MKDKKLVTTKKAHELTGASVSFIKQLLRERKLTTFKIHSATYIDLHEFEKIALPITSSKPSQNSDARQ